MKKQKADISLGATQKEREDVVERIKNIQRLLKHFNLSAFAFDPGVKCLILGDISSQVRYVDFDESTWEFIKPLLKELLKYRRRHEVASKRSS